MNTGGVSFDDMGERMAYWLHGKKISGGLDQQRNGQLIICDAKDGWRELRRVHFPNLGLAQQLQFSPGDGRYLLAASRINGGTMLILDAETGEQPAWSRCFRALTLPPGELPFHTVHWVAPKPAATADGSKDEVPLILQAAVGGQLHLFDVTAFIAPFELPSGLPEQQRLVRVCEAFPDDRIGAVLGATKASADVIRAVLADIDADAVEIAAEHHPWLRAFTPGAEQVTADAGEEAGGAAAKGALKSAIEARTDVSVVSFLLGQWSGDAAPTAESSDGVAMPLLYRRPGIRDAGAAARRRGVLRPAVHRRPRHLGLDWHAAEASAATGDS